MKKKILILATHMDDDVISFGGLIIKMISRGHDVYVHAFTCGGPCSNVPSEVRSKEFIECMKFLGVTNYSYSGIEMDGLLDTIPNTQLTGLIDELINEIHPDEVYCSPVSEHSDHQALHKAFLGSCRLKSGFMPKLCALGVYQFSDQLYTQNVGGKIFLPLTEEEFEKKLKAFEIYKSQWKPAPSPLGETGLRNLARHCGMLCGHQYAELFYQLRYIRSM